MEKKRIRGIVEELYNTVNTLDEDKTFDTLYSRYSDKDILKAEITVMKEMEADEKDIAEAEELFKVWEKKDRDILMLKKMCENAGISLPGI